MKPDDAFVASVVAAVHSPSPVTSPLASPRGGAKAETAVLLYDYDGSVPNSLKLAKDSVVTVLSKADAWWYCVAEGGRTGYLPESFLESDH
jgi:hypothetical protein